MASVGWALVAVCSQPPTSHRVWTDIDDIAGRAGQYFGSTVAVAGEVGQILGPGVFTIGGADGEVLVAGAVTREALRTGDTVEVAGRVRAFSVHRIEAEIGYELANVNLRQGEPVIVVRQVLDRRALGSRSSAAE